MSFVTVRASPTWKTMTASNELELTLWRKPNRFIRRKTS